MEKQKALVVLSGGQDSVTCLAWALHEYDEVEAITFVYGQRHMVELTCAQGVCRDTGTQHKVVNMSFIADVSVSALTGDGDISARHPQNENLPASFVPNRNALFLTVAHAWAQTIGAQHVVTGVCETDFSGYPDCRESFVRQLGVTLNAGAETAIGIVAPLMYMNKAHTFKLADDLGALDMVLEMSHTCYEGDRSVRHAWGYGCGVCPACVLRADGWDQYQVELSNGL